MGVGLPLAAAEKVTVWPEGTVWLIGWVVITGATVLTDMVAALDVTDPAELVNTARTSQPFTKAVSGPVVKLGEVSPATLPQLDPPFSDNCH